MHGAAQKIQSKLICISNRFYGAAGSKSRLCSTSRSPPKDRFALGLELEGGEATALEHACRSARRVGKAVDPAGRAAPFARRCLKTAQVGIKLLRDTDLSQFKHVNGAAAN